MAVVAGADGWAPLVAFALAGFAAGAALRQLVLATRRQGWRGLLGRANGGMIVHLGVILIAVALVASNAYTKSAELTVRTGEAVEWEGHTFELVDVVAEQSDRTNVVRANVLLDGSDVYGPAVTTYLRLGSTIGTPSVRAGLTGDVYLTIAGNRPPEAGRRRRCTSRCSSSR